MGQTLFRNARVFDGNDGELAEGHHVLIEDGLIREASETRIASRTAEVIDLAGAVPMPGLIDAHVPSSSA